MLFAYIIRSYEYKNRSPILLRITSLNVDRFWPVMVRNIERDALHSAVYAVVRCMSVRPSHAGIVSKWLNLS